MRKVLFGIFAHPDDEAFGPSGTLLKAVVEGVELHLILLTSGDAGTNPDNHADLGAVRLEEWRKASQLLHATSMHYLGYRDGHLDNNAMIEVSEKISVIIQETLTAYSPTLEKAEVEFLTLDLNGLTGHIDHIVAARAASLAFYRLKAEDQRFRRILYYCLPQSLLPRQNTDWIFMEAGRTPEEISLKIDARHLQAEIKAVVAIHHTQRGDAQHMLQQQGDNLGLDHFITRS